MKRAIEKLLREYGTKLYLEHQGASLELKAFLQPVRAKGKGYAEHSLEAFGQYPLGQHLFIGPPDIPAAQGDVIRRGTQRFVLRRVEFIFAGEEKIYCWGLCVKEGETAWTELSNVSFMA